MDHIWNCERASRNPNHPVTYLRDFFDDIDGKQRAICTACAHQGEEPRATVPVRRQRDHGSIPQVHSNWLSDDSDSENRPSQIPRLHSKTPVSYVHDFQLVSPNSARQPFQCISPMRVRRQNLRRAPRHFDSSPDTPRGQTAFNDVQ
jgi:hypothetical protein